MVTCSLDTLKKFEEKRNENKKGKSRVVTTNHIQQKGNKKVKDRDNEILSFDFEFVFVG